jgi:hypothetical protein
MRQLMRKLCLLSTIALMACSTSNNKFDEIEFIAYTYAKFESQNEKFTEEWRLIAPYYFHVDSHYNCEIIFKKYADSAFAYLHTSDLIKSGKKILIDEIINSIKFVGPDTDLRPKFPPPIYDGPSLKIRITHQDEIKTIHFYQTWDSSDVYERLYNFVDQIYKMNVAKKVDENLLRFGDRRIDLIKYCWHSDSTLRPLPPLPPRDIIRTYTPPVIVR